MRSSPGRRQDQVVPGVATLDRSEVRPNQSPVGWVPYPLVTGNWGNQEGGNPEWSTDQGGPRINTLWWIFFRTCLQGLSLTVGYLLWRNTFSFSTFGPPWSPDTSTLIRKQRNYVWLTFTPHGHHQRPRASQSGSGKMVQWKVPRTPVLENFCGPFRQKPDWLGLGLQGYPMVSNKLQVLTIFYQLI